MGQIHIFYYFNLFPALFTSELNTESFSDIQTTPTIPIGLHTELRKRKAQILCADIRELYQAQIFELHITQGAPLRAVKEKMEKVGFSTKLPF